MLDQYLKAWRLYAYMIVAIAILYSFSKTYTFRLLLSAAFFRWLLIEQHPNTQVP